MQPSRPGTRVWVAVPALAALLLAGCSAATSPAATPSASAPSVATPSTVSSTAPVPSSVPLARSSFSPGPSASWMGASAAGTLLADAHGCLVVVDSGFPLKLLWPLGFVARSTPTTVEVLDGGGRVVARTGQPVSVTGGGAPPTDEGPCAASRGDYFEVDAVLSAG